MNTPEETYMEWRQDIADALAREEMNMSNEEKWIRELGFWIGGLLFLGIVWIVLVVVIPL